MTYFEGLIESFEDITENWWQNRARWELRWCRLLPWAAAACQGHSKMVVFSSLALPLPAPREIRFAAAAARAGIRMCETGASCLRRSLLLPGDLPSERSCLRWGHDLRGCFFLVYIDVILTNCGGLFKSCLREHGWSLCYVPATSLWCSPAGGHKPSHPPLSSELDFVRVPGDPMDGTWQCSLELWQLYS